ncbi:PadR family transcriptional regulator [Lactobacillaceae bacterium Scapto_B20]
MAIKIPTELLDGCVLGLLNQNDYYGYALTKEVQLAIDVASSTIYPVMRRLKASGLVATYDKPYNGRNRRYYQITEDGINRLKELQSEWLNFESGINQLLGGTKE